jgi:saccharopine dehydrogenase-like NADP-dependent oxidoreductase
MAVRVLVIGDYGQFGSYIARSLAGDAEIGLLVGGHSVAKAQAISRLYSADPSRRSPCARVNGDLPEALSRIAPQESMNGCAAAATTSQSSRGV